MKNINIRRRSHKGINRFNTQRPKRNYFISQTKLLELEREREPKIKKLMIFTIIMAFLAPSVLGGCSSIQNTDSTSSGKSKSGYEKRSGGYSSGY
jgi:hypothetical protein